MQHHKGTIEIYYLSELESVPSDSKSFDANHYRYAGQSWPLQEFDGMFQILRHAQCCHQMERPLGTGDILFIRWDALNLIATLVVLERQATLLWNGEHHKLFVGDADEPVLMQLPRSLYFRNHHAVALPNP